MRILLIKMSSMGDVFHVFPALSDALKAKPNLEIDWIVEKDFAEIPQWHPAVKKVWVIELRKWCKNPFKFRQQIKQFFLAINQQDYDLVIDAQGLLKSAWVSFKIKSALKKVGFDWTSVREPLASLFYQAKIKVAKQQHAITRLRELFAKSLGYEWQENSIINYGLSTESWQPLAEINKPYCVFLHGTTWETKLWPEEYWVELASKLEYKNITIVLPWGNEAEKQRSERLNAKIHQGWVPQTRLSLNKMAICLKHADFVVSVDTGLSHVSAALEVPMVVLYRVTDPVLIGSLGNKVEQLKSPCASLYLKHFTGTLQELESLHGLSASLVFDTIVSNDK